MSDQNVSPPTGRPPEPDRLVFFNVKDNKFVYSPEKGAKEIETDFVNGYIQEFYYAWDLGHQAARAQDSVPARWTLILTLNSPGIGRVKLEVGPMSSVYSLASQIVQAPESAYLGLVIKPGESNGYLVNSTYWTPEKGYTHLFTGKKDERPLEDRHAEAIEKSLSHPNYAIPAGGDIKGRRVMLQNGHATGNPDAHKPASQAGGNPGGGGSAGVKLEFPPVPEGTEAFGYVPSLWPLKAWFSEKPDNVVVDRYITRCSRREIDEDAVRDKLLFVINDEFRSLSTGDFFTRAEYALAGDFVLKASAEQLAEAVLEAKTFLEEEAEEARLQASTPPTGSPPQSPPPADEYDPFADE